MDWMVSAEYYMKNSLLGRFYPILWVALFFIVEIFIFLNGCILNCAHRLVGWECLLQEALQELAVARVIGIIICEEVCLVVPHHSLKIIKILFFRRAFLVVVLSLSILSKIISKIIFSHS